MRKLILILTLFLVAGCGLQSDTSDYQSQVLGQSAIQRYREPSYLYDPENDCYPGGYTRSEYLFRLELKGMVQKVYELEKRLNESEERLDRLE